MFFWKKFRRFTGRGLKGALLRILSVCLLAVFLIFGIVLAVKAHRRRVYDSSFGKVAASVGTYDADFGLYRYFYLTYRDELLPDYTTEVESPNKFVALLRRFLKTDTLVDERGLDSAIRARVGEALCGQAALLSLAAEYGIVPQSPDILAAVDTFTEEQKKYFKKQKKDPTDAEEDPFAEMLDKNHMTEDVLHTLLCTDEVEARLFAKVLAEGKRIETEDDRIAEILRSEAFACAKAVCVYNDEDDDLAVNRTVAEKVVAEYESGTPFETLVTLYSEEYAMPADGYYFMSGAMPAVYDAVFALEPDEISGVVEDEDGFYILLRLKKDENYLRENFTELKTQYQKVCFSGWIAERAAPLYAKETEYTRSISYKEFR